MGPRSTAGARAESLRASEGECERIGAEERAALAFFSVEGIGPATLGALRRAFGSLAEAMDAPRERVLEHLRDVATRARFSAVDDLGALADGYLERAEALSARVLFPGRSGWPQQLEGLDFPPVLYVRGALDPAQKKVALVGSRNSDPYGLELADFYASALANQGVIVVSGGAVGVDGTAHRAVLSRGGSTAAVLGSGVDRAYPGEHRALFKQMIAQGGAVVSHFPPGTPGVAQNFVVRNRLIAALCDAVIVARAGSHSGALGTARAALALGRPVFAVPGDVTCPLSVGCNALVESGQARALVSLEGVARALALARPENARSDAAEPVGAPAAGAWPTAAPGGAKLKRPRARSSQLAPTPVPERPSILVNPLELPADLRSVWEGLRGGPTQFDELVAHTGLDAARLANALVRLEVMGLCRERSGKVFARV